MPPSNKKNGTTNGKYRYIWKPLHPHASNSGYVEEHRLVIENILGRILDKDEVVHHIDNDGFNNSPGNLLLMTKKTHDRLHMIIMETCSLPGCGNPHRARGLCGSHYGKYYRSGKAFPRCATRKNRWTREEG